MDMSVEGEVLGRVVIGLLDPGSLAARRFSDLCRGIQGVSYKRSRFDAIFEVRASLVLHSTMPWFRGVARERSSQPEASRARV